MDFVNKKFYVNFLGCEKRKLDSQRIINYLKANGWHSANIKEAELIVFLTCAFCQKYEDYSVGKLEKVYRQKKASAIFVIGGCLTIINPKRFAPFPNSIQIQTRELDKLDALIHATIPMAQIPDTNITIFDYQHISGKSVGENPDEEDETEELTEQIQYRTMKKGKRFRTPAQKAYEKAKLGYKIRINWGCLGNCAYCVTRLAEKTLESKPLDLIL